MPGLSLEKQGVRLRIYISESDRWRGKSLDAALLETLRGLGMAGASVFRGIAGFGAQSRIHTTDIEVLSFNLPMVVEVIDSPEKIAEALEHVYPMVREGLITMEDVEIVKYTHRFLNPLPADKLVSEVMTREVIAIEQNATVYQAWKLMIDKAVKALPITNSAGGVAGILTDEDLTERAGIRQRLSIALRLDPSEVTQELQALGDTSQTVSEVMTSPAVTVLESDNLGHATALMTSQNLKRLPVVNEKGLLTGMLSRLDVLRQVSNAPVPAAQAPLPMESMRTVGEVMSKDIPMVDRDDTLSTIIDKFSRALSHRLIVIDSDGKALGLLSDSDVVVRVQPAQKAGILNALRSLGKTPAGKETAGELMSPGVLTVTPQTTVAAAARLMLDQGRKWMVVVDESQKPVGLVDRQILLEALSSHYRK
jgi:CBS-domain-containing membrane protein